MNIYKEIEEIGKICEERNEKLLPLVLEISKKVNMEGLDFGKSYLITDCEEKDGHLHYKGVLADNEGEDGDCYVWQMKGPAKGHYFGECYFKTETPGLFVAVPFDIK